MQNTKAMSMLVVTATYADDNNNIKFTREVAADSDLRMIVGEMIYGVEVQVPLAKTFTTDDVFVQATIPDEFKQNCTVVDVLDDEKAFSLKVTIARKNKK